MTHRKIVNVGSVPKLSPFRYPGGKTWLIPQIRKWLGRRDSAPGMLYEIFAGGGIVGLTAGFEGLAKHVTLVERDEEVAAVWKTILSKDANWLANEILNFNLTVENARDILSSTTRSTKRLAFKTILKNRTHHGGILAHGSSMVRFGENGKGIKSRWYPNTLAERIRAIYYMRDRFTFVEGDGLEVLAANLDKTNCAFFIDPPYTAAGKRAGTRLYKYNELDHDGLFSLASRAISPCLMTYDNADGVIELAKRYGFQWELIPMKNTHHAEMTELLISKDLSWLRSNEMLQQPSLFNE